MLYSTRSLIRHVLTGNLVFIAIVAGGTYFLQNSLVLVKNYGAYTHWATILFLLPVVAGILHRIARIQYPLINVLGGTLASTAILYPQYKTFWAIPPTLTDIAIYSFIIFGIGFLATQSIRQTVLLAFRMGRYSVQQIPLPGKNGKRRTRPAKTQAAQASHGQTLALLELTIGVCSLALSIFSVFFLGRS